jgi:hypothetical protein
VDCLQIVLSNADNASLAEANSGGIRAQVQ